MGEQASSKPFLKDDDKMLWLGLLQRDTGIPASQHLLVRDEVLALDFNLAVTLRLSRYDCDVMKTQAKRIAYEVSKIFSDREDDTDDFISNDPYADKDTQIM